MSFKALSWAAQQKLPAMQKIVLMMLANRFNDDSGECYPSINTLADECGMARRSLIYQLDELEKKELVQVSRTTVNGIKKINKYKLRINEINSATDALGSATDALGVVQEMHEGSARDAHIETVIETISLNSKDKHRENRFLVPDLQEIKDHIKNLNYSVDAEAFQAFYNSNNWMVGKNKMKCWKSAIVTWEKRNGKNNNHQKQSQKFNYSDAVEKVFNDLERNYFN